MRHFVIIESPYGAGSGAWDDPAVQQNLAYLRAAIHDSITRHNEAPFASHGLYTQPGVLHDGVPEERAMGIDAGLEIGLRCDYTVVYCDRGLSRGMLYGIEAAVEAGRPIVFRSLEEDPQANAMIVESAKVAAGFVTEEKP